MQGKWISKLVSYQKLESLIGTHNSMDTEIVNLQRGAFILSLDVELAWGSVHRNKLAQREKYFVETRSNIQRLLKILERYQIHATWAVIGHLFLDRCLPVNGINHPEIIRPINQDGEDWFLQDPCSTLQDSPIWYGSDIIQQIVNCSVHQEIGCHTFSHVQAGGPGCGPECFDSELRACRVEAEKLKLELKSFVFPRNEIGYLDILKENGFTVYRGNTNMFDRLPDVVARLCRLVYGYMPTSPPVVLPTKVDQLWNIPASFFYPSTFRWLKPVSNQLRFIKTMMGLNKAVEKRRILHLWFHPFNLANQPDTLFEQLEKVFCQVDRYRKVGKIDNFTMRDLAEYLDRK